MTKPKSITRLDNLTEAYRQIVLGAAVNFPEGAPDHAKWEWAQTLTDVLVEAYKRKDLTPVSRIVKTSERAVRRLYERRRADAIVASAQSLKPLEVPGEDVSREKPS
jgi:hypothetical protein